MPQISLYIDEETLEKLKAAASRERISISKWVAHRIRSQVEPEYPAYYDELFGSIDDETFTEPEKINVSLDSFRESM
ncbi:MAG: hypothetical protein K9M94_14300 [Spirochaetia bacterium]|nr:hypothetical protein [Spirochaetia bacterium]